MAGAPAIFCVLPTQNNLNVCRMQYAFARVVDPNVCAHDLFFGPD